MEKNLDINKWRSFKILNVTMSIDKKYNKDRNGVFYT